MQESNEHGRLLLLLVVLLRRSGCLKNRHFDKYTRHLYRILWNAALCAQGYQQKMWNENSGNNILDSVCRNMVDNDAEM